MNEKETFWKERTFDSVLTFEEYFNFEVKMAKQKPNDDIQILKLKYSPETQIATMTIKQKIKI